VLLASCGITYDDGLSEVMLLCALDSDLFCENISAIKINADFLLRVTREFDVKVSIKVMAQNM
jgi:hypothetical protein